MISSISMLIMRSRRKALTESIEAELRTYLRNTSSDSETMIDLRTGVLAQNIVARFFNDPSTKEVCPCCNSEDCAGKF